MRDRGPAPIVTWVSDVGRIELSAITFNNAISKASNYLVDGLELEEDATVSVSLGNHWQSPIWFGVALSTGLTIVENDPAITFGANAAAQTWQGSPDEFVVVSRDPFGMPEKDIPAGFINGSAEVRNFGDFFSQSTPLPMPWIHEAPRSRGMPLLGISWVLIRPPILSLASYTIRLGVKCLRSEAAERPEIPAPKMWIEGFLFGLLRRYSRVS